jgi:hypothetical protein
VARSTALLAALLATASRWCDGAASLGTAVGVFRFLFCRLQNLEGAHERVVNAHHGARIVELAAVIWCRKQCYQLPLREEFVAVFNYLVCAAHEVHVVLVQKLANHLAAKSERNATVVLAPSTCVLQFCIAHDEDEKI